jgi:uncharacterized protein DUF4189
MIYSGTLRGEGSMKMLEWRAIVAACFIAFYVTPTTAATQSDWDSCTSQDADRNIAACSRIIDDSSTTVDDRVDAYMWRGGNYLAKNNLDLALNDYSDAIKLNPRNIAALGSRAIANYRKGNREQAVLDYSVAKGIDSNKLDTMATNSDELKEVAKIAIKEPVPQAQLDALLDRLKPKTLTCAAGSRLDGSVCVPITCPTGQRLSGSSCQAIVCDAGETLEGDQCVRASKYIALAIGGSKRLSYGVVWNRDSMERAKDDALGRCYGQVSRGGKCKIILTGVDNCVALSWTSPGNGWGGAARNSKSEAQNAALASCQGANRRSKCILAGAWCNN